MIFLVRIGTVNSQDLDWLARELPKRFKGQAAYSLAQKIKLPGHLYHRRGQSSAAQVREFVEVEISCPTRRQLARDDRLLFLADYDLFLPGLNFVFGVAQPGNARAIVALPRLREAFYCRPRDEDLFRTRLLKESAHELGHTYGLKHCPARACVMHFSNSLRDTDIKTAQFCEDCHPSTHSVPY